MQLICALAVAIALALCSIGQCQELPEFERFAQASPAGPGWMPPDRFPSFLEWLEKEVARTADPERRSELLATAAFVRYCKKEEDLAAQLLENAISQHSPVSDRCLIIAARILGTTKSVEQLDTIPIGSKWYIDAALQKAAFYGAKNKHVEALRILEGVGEENVFVHYRRAASFFRLGREREAQAELKRYMENCETGPMEQMSSAIVLLAATHMQLEENIEAVNACERGLKSYPKDVSLRYIMVRVLCKLDRGKEAFAFAKGLEIDQPGSTQSTFAMGVSLFCICEFKKSILYLERANKMLPVDFWMAYYLACAQMYCKQNAEAALVVERYLASSEHPQNRRDMTFLGAINESYSTELSVERKAALKDVLREGVEQARTSKLAQAFACGGIYKMGDPQLAKELLEKKLPEFDFDKLMAKVQDSGTLWFQP